MVIRFADTGETAIIDYREVAPLAATEDMYELDADGNVVDNANSRGAIEPWPFPGRWPVSS